MRIEFEDTQDVKVLEDKLYNLRHILNMNLKVCKDVGNVFAQHSNPGALLDTVASDSAILGFVREMEIQLERMLTLKQRTEAVSDLVNLSSILSP